MSARFDPYGGDLKFADGMAKTEAVIDESTLSANLRHLLKLRVSQINGCAYCVNMHLEEARRDGETDTRLDKLCIWREVPDFTSAEKAALAWAEALTLVSQTASLSGLYEDLKPHFSGDDIRAMAYSIAMINAWNRLAIAAHGRMA